MGAPAGHLEGTRAVLPSADPGSSQAAYKCSSPASTTTLSLFVIPSSVHTCARLHLKKKEENPRNRLDVVRQHKAECESVDL